MTTNNNNTNLVRLTSDTTTDKSFTEIYNSTVFKGLQVFAYADDEQNALTLYSPRTDINQILLRPDEVSKGLFVHNVYREQVELLAARIFLIAHNAGGKLPTTDFGDIHPQTIHNASNLGRHKIFDVVKYSHIKEGTAHEVGMVRNLKLDIKTIKYFETIVRDFDADFPTTILN